MFTEVQAQQLNVDFKFLNARRGIEGQTTADPKDFRVIAVRAAQYGALEPGSVSAWVRAMVELDREGVIRLRKPAPQPVEIDQSFRDEVARMPSSELLKRINTDATFKAKFDALAQEDATRSSDVEPEVTLTRQDYYSIPAATIARKYAASPAFRRAVDKLITAGEI